MTALIIEYRDFSGDVSKRSISDFKPEGDDSVVAFCHLRNSRRTFKIPNIISAVHADTGEVVDNLWRLFGLEKQADGREKLVSVLLTYLPAIKTLKFFSMITRGFAKRERSHIIKFIKDNVSIDEYTDDELDQWLSQLWCADVYAFRDGKVDDIETLVKQIPDSLRASCRIVAFSIAIGSGRKKIPAETAALIDSLFAKPA